jgi:hypothetical protein
MDNFEGTLVDKCVFITSKVIDSKKLQFNYIWANKITQEELTTPKALEDNIMNLKLVQNTFDLILIISNKINAKFEFLFNIPEVLSEPNEEICNEVYNILRLTSAMIQKCKNFLEIKTKQFKITKESLLSLINLRKYYSTFVNNIKSEDLSKRIDEYYQLIQNFLDILTTDNHVKEF